MMLIITGDKVDRMDFEEATHRFAELEALLRDCHGVPEDSALWKEFMALKTLLDTPLAKH
jgi:hypothetical protein